MKSSARFCLPLAIALFAAGCGSTDQRSFAVENAIFESLVVERALPLPRAAGPAEQASIGEGLAAVCRGNTAGARRLIRDSAIGPQIYRLLLVAAKAARDGRCDFSDWPEQQTLLGDRFKQLVSSGDAAAVLLAALLDTGLAPADRKRVAEALAERKYGHAEAVYADLLLAGDPGPADYAQAHALLEDAARQGADPAWLLLARLYRDGRGVPQDIGKACAHFSEAARRGIAAASAEGARLACPAA